MSKFKEKLEAAKHHRPSVLLALSWYSSQIQEGVAAFAKKSDWHLNTEMYRSGRIPDNWQGDGIICVLGMDAEIDRRIEAMNTPAVSIGPVGTDRIPHVMADNRHIGQLAGEHFLERGFRHFAFYQASGGSAERDRMQAFEAVVAERCTSFTYMDWDKFHRRSKVKSKVSQHQWLEQQVKKLPRPVAILAEYDDRAVEVMRACQSAGIPVPEQAAVLGVDNDPLVCDFAPVPLSSVDDDQRLQGYTAAEVLDRMMQGQRDVPLRYEVSPKHVATRQSTDIFAVEHPHVAKTLRIIWQHFAEPITAEEVASVVPMSYRRLHDAFVRHTGRTVAEELTRRRVEHAQSLLAGRPRRKMEEVARLSGFSSADLMARVFSRTLGITPSAYRKTHQLKAPQ